MSDIPQYSTLLFTDVYSTVDSFVSDYKSLKIPTTISDDHANLLYWLLYGRYGNNPIANQDTNQWKYKMFSVIWQYGPEWEKDLAIQEKLRGLTDDEIKQEAYAEVVNDHTINTTRNDTMTGTDITNHAYNPSTDPSTQATTELTYVDSQNVQKNDDATTGTYSGTTKDTTTNTRNTAILDGYTKLTALLKSDVTEAFINRFKYCFKVFVKPEQDFIFESED